MPVHSLQGQQSDVAEIKQNKKWDVKEKCLPSERDLVFFPQINDFTDFLIDASSMCESVGKKNVTSSDLLTNSGSSSSDSAERD